MQTQSTSSVSTPKTGNQSDSAYESYLGRVQARFDANIQPHGALFTTDATHGGALWEAYINSFPDYERQHHNCNACRHFLNRFGGLVTIDPEGATASAMWSFLDSDPAHEKAVIAMSAAIRRAKVTGVFLSSEHVWGHPETGVWRHLSIVQPVAMRFSRVTQNASQAMAEKREDFKNVARALGEYKQPLVEQALALLKSEALYRAEKVAGPAQWLSEVHAAIKDVHGTRRDNILWRFIAAAPAGFCHPRSSMVGTLLDDLAAGLSFEDAAAKFKAKMHPLAYQRPQAAPSAGNIAQAEKIVEQMGIARSLERRFARLEDIETVWRPEVERPSVLGGSSGVFSHLKPKDAASAPAGIDVPTQLITWEKFARTVLPDALSMEVFVPSNGNFCALLTAVHPDAPPILQWDTAERRNPVSLYVYNGGSLASQWGLTTKWNLVTAVALRPSQWFDATLEHHGVGALFVIDGARDARDSGSAIFPESLKSELHGIRSTIEAYSKSASLSGREEASACGLLIGKDGDATVRVTIGSGVRAQYRIERWD